MKFSELPTDASFVLDNKLLYKISFPTAALNPATGEVVLVSPDDKVHRVEIDCRLEDLGKE